MPKIKTHKGAQDRFHITGSGKIMRMKIGKSHLRRKKPKSVRRMYDNKMVLHPSVEKRIRKMLPRV